MTKNIMVYLQGKPKIIGDYTWQALMVTFLSVMVVSLLVIGSGLRSINFGLLGCMAIGLPISIIVSLVITLLLVKNPKIIRGLLMKRGVDVKFYGKWSIGR